MGYSRSTGWGRILATLGVVMLILAHSGPPVSRAIAQQAPAKPAAKAATSDTGLNARLARLEEQLVDMQVMIATLETLVKSGGSGQAAAAPAADGGGSGNLPWRSDAVAAPPATTDSAGDARLSALETQIQALTSQISLITSRLDKLQGTQASGVRPTQPFAPPGAGAPPGTGAPPAPGAPAEPVQPSPSVVVPSAANTEYQQAYSHLLSQDFKAAETAFANFLKRHPKDKLAGNAKYWLGETYYSRRSYRKAADAFLRSYTDHPSGDKAGESLLKLGMSLRQIGQKQAACATFSELKKRFPNAPAALQQRASRESQQSGCR